VTFLSTPVGKRIPNKFTEHNVSPQVTLSWHPTKDILLYGAYKTGFKSGGISAPALIPAFAAADPKSQRFSLETVEGGEIGAKASNIFGRLTGDLTFYHYTYSGLQLTAFDAATTSYFTQNAAGATIEGIELNSTFRVTPEFSIHGSSGYNHARYDSFPDSQCWTGQPVVNAQGVLVDATTGLPVGASDPFVQAAHGRYCRGGVQNLTGAALSRAPNWSAILGGSYERHAFGSYTLGLTADARYSGAYNLQTNNSPFALQKDYTLLDLSARLYNAKWEFSVIARNVTDVQYAVLGGDKPLGPGGQILAAVGQPREVFLQVTRRF